MRLAVVALLCAACGRIGFEPGDAGVADGPRLTWRLVQTLAVTHANLISIAPSTAGSLMVVGVDQMGGDTVASIGDDVDPTYTAIPAARVARSGGGVIEVWYLSGAGANARTITINEQSGMAPPAAVVWEVANIKPTGAVDTAITASSTTTTSSTVVSGAQIATAMPGDFVISIGLVMNAVTGSHSGSEFTNDSTVNGNGWAHLTDPQAPSGPHHAVWDVDVAGNYASATVAFYAGP